MTIVTANAERAGSATDSSAANLQISFTPQRNMCIGVVVYEVISDQKWSVHPMPPDLTPVAVPPLFVRLVRCTALGVLAQAVTAGAFVSQDGRDSWVNVHGVIADVTWVLALISAIYAYRVVRPTGDRRL